MRVFNPTAPSNSAHLIKQHSWVLFVSLCITTTGYLPHRLDTRNFIPDHCPHHVIHVKYFSCDVVCCVPHPLPFCTSTLHLLLVRLVVALLSNLRGPHTYPSPVLERVISSCDDLSRPCILAWRRLFISRCIHCVPSLHRIHIAALHELIPDVHGLFELPPDIVMRRFLY